MARARSAAVSLVLLGALTVALLTQGASFVAPRGAAKVAAPSHGPAASAAGALLLASAPMPAYAGGMFDFGLTLPFVAITFLTMMAVLNALWYAPVGDEMEDRNSKLLETLSQATDMLTKADTIQVEYTEKIREAREKASAAVNSYRDEIKKTMESKISAAKAAQASKADDLKQKLEQDVQSKMSAAEPEIEKRKAEFVKATLSSVSLA